MKRFLFAVGVIAAIGGCSHNQKTEDSAATMAPASAPMAETRVGIVSMATPSQLTVRAVPPGAVAGGEVVGYSPATALVRGGQPGNWSDVAQGTPVRVTYTMQNGMAQAQQVEILTGQEAESVMEQGKAAYGNAVMPMNHSSGQKPTPMK